MWMETAAGERFSDLRMQEAAKTGAEIVVTSCPHCISCLEDSLSAVPDSGLRVLDLAEVADMALQVQGTPAEAMASGRA